jgi:hypothetical protein
MPIRGPNKEEEMSAIKRAGVQWDDEYLISEKDRSECRWEQSEDSRSGKEFCTVDGVRYLRYDCYVDFSPYGWKRLDAQAA